MSIVDNIRIIKKVHIKDIAMVQVGKFIYAYGKDAYIMSYVFWIVNPFLDNFYKDTFLYSIGVK